MPRLSEALRAERRRHVMISAWSCFSRNGFHATSMDDVIGATGMSSSAVYRYFRSKDELIEAAADEALQLTRELYERLLAAEPVPGPAETVSALHAELRSRSAHPDYDLSRILVQTWAEALRHPALRERTERFQREARGLILRLAERWQEEGLLPAGARTQDVAEAVSTIMRGLLASYPLSGGPDEDGLLRGLGTLGEVFAAARPH